MTRVQVLVLRWWIAGNDGGAEVGGRVECNCRSAEGKPQSMQRNIQRSSFEERREDVEWWVSCHRADKVKGRVRRR